MFYVVNITNISISDLLLCIYQLCWQMGLMISKQSEIKKKL